ncbi:fasciclin domain-containing protein [Pelobium manganitolerans]|uniref:fasciclin domain-containing protein n=1 Tax=Pelobium manganitolerans TaxID=1842495 RepID=UPI003FA355E4
MKTINKTLSLVALAISIWCLACNNSSTNNSASSAVDAPTSDSANYVSTADSGVMVGAAMMVPQKTIVQNLVGSSAHSVLLTAIKKANLEETLAGKGPFTIFAPSNTAFNNLPNGKLEDLLKPENKSELSKLLTNHIVSGNYKTADLKDGMELQSLAGNILKVSVKDGLVKVNNVKISLADAISSNGVIHVVDALLQP